MFMTTDAAACIAAAILSLAMPFPNDQLVAVPGDDTVQTPGAGEVHHRIATMTIESVSPQRLIEGRVITIKGNGFKSGGAEFQPLPPMHLVDNGDSIITLSSTSASVEYPSFCVIYCTADGEITWPLQVVSVNDTCIMAKVPPVPDDVDGKAGFIEVRRGIGATVVPSPFFNLTYEASTVFCGLDRSKDIARSQDPVTPEGGPGSTLTYKWYWHDSGVLKLTPPALRANSSGYKADNGFSYCHPDGTHCDCIVTKFTVSAAGASNVVMGNGIAAATQEMLIALGINCFAAYSPETDEVILSCAGGPIPAPSVIELFGFLTLTPL